MTIATPAFHDTIVLERTYAAPPARVFQAFANVEARLHWGTPSSATGLVYDAADFRVGGVDISRCGPKGHLIYRVESRYWDIVPDVRIIWSEAVSEGVNRLSISLITVALEAAEGGTRLAFTDQIVAYGSASMIEGSRQGYAAALDSLHAEFARIPGGTL
jgi:uncharacterized protein YndB with AHSA1/START domain